MRTLQQNKNLVKLAKYLLALPGEYENFNMNVYNTSGIDHIRRGLPPECGTAACAVGHGPAAACAVGHGPAAGIPMPDELIITSEDGESIDWWDYAKLFTEDEEEFNWMFHGNWHWSDNTVVGAALRILILLDKGLEDDSVMVYLNTKTYTVWKESYLILLNSADLSILELPEYQ